jgi:hypothetical protein
MPVRTVDVSPGGFFARPRTARRFRAVPSGSAGKRADGEAERRGADKAAGAGCGCASLRGLRKIPMPAAEEALCALPQVARLGVSGYNERLRRDMRGLVPSALHEPAEAIRACPFSGKRAPRLNARTLGGENPPVPEPSDSVRRNPERENPNP